METKYVIIMHNQEGHSLEESPLLDSYPKPEVIEFYLSQSNYSFAKVEKRYTLGSIEQAHARLNAPKSVYEVVYITDDGMPSFFGTHDKNEFEGFILNLKDQGLLYETRVT